MKSFTKRLILFVGAILIATVVTLAFTPHYGCACGQDLPRKRTVQSFPLSCDGF
jgi:hypothetical protein